MAKEAPSRIAASSWREPEKLGQATIRRDDCGDHALFGRLGHIYAVPEGFQLVIDGKSSRRWNLVKLRLSFCRLAQNGDDEGTMFLERLPTVTEARLIREALGIRRAPVICSDARARKVLGAKALSDGDARREPGHSSANITPEAKVEKFPDEKGLSSRQIGKPRSGATRVAACDICRKYPISRAIGREQVRGVNPIDVAEALETRCRLVAPNQICSQVAVGE